MIKPDYYKYKTEKEKWVAAGKPTRSLEKIGELFKICGQCEEHIEITSTIYQCSICTCILRENSKKGNKLAYATTRCPKENPEWVEEPGYEQPVQTSELNENIETPQVEPQQQYIKRPPKNGGCGCS